MVTPLVLGAESYCVLDLCAGKAHRVLIWINKDLNDVLLRW